MNWLRGLAVVTVTLTPLVAGCGEAPRSAVEYGDEPIVYDVSTRADRNAAFSFSDHLTADYLESRDGSFCEESESPYWERRVSTILPDGSRVHITIKSTDGGITLHHAKIDRLQDSGELVGMIFEPEAERGVVAGRIGDWRTRIEIPDDLLPEARAIVDAAMQLPCPM